MTVRAFSFGGGVQSVACLVLAAQGRIDYRTFVFSNVGDDSEYPGTIDYMREHVRPYAQAHGLELIEVMRRRRDGTPVTLLGEILRDDKSLPIPVRMDRTLAPGRRSCTRDFKVRPIAKWFKQQGATEADPGVCGVGISTDEAIRMRVSSIPHQVLDYPLIELGLNRADCKAIIRDAGLPEPPKSSCWFCPFHSGQAWRDLYDSDRPLFEKAADLEAFMNERNAKLGRDKTWFSAWRKPLREVVTGVHREQLAVFEGAEQHNCAPFACTVGFRTED